LKTVAVEQGKYQIQEVTYDKKGKSTIVPLSEWKEIIPEVFSPTLILMDYNRKESMKSV